MSFNGDLYPTAGADVVMTTSGDMVKYESGARARLGIGSANQILQVKSSLPSWETLSTAGSILTTQGDILYEGASALARLGQSTNFHTLATKGSGANPAWQASATSTMTAAQDILYSSSTNTLARLGAGTDGDVLTTHSTGSAPTWETPSGGGSWTLLDEESVANDATDTTHTFSFSPSLDLMNGGDYNALYCIGKGRTSEACNVQCKISSLSEYHTQFTQNLAGTVSGVSDTSSSEIDLVQTSLINVARPFSFGFYIIQQFASATGATEQDAYWGFGNATSGFSTFRGHTVNLGDADIASILFNVSAGDYTGTDFRIYGIKTT